MIAKRNAAARADRSAGAAGARGWVRDRPRRSCRSRGRRGRGRGHPGARRMCSDGRALQRRRRRLRWCRRRRLRAGHRSRKLRELRGVVWRGPSARHARLCRGALRPRLRSGVRRLQRRRGRWLRGVARRRGELRAVRERVRRCDARLRPVRVRRDLPAGPPALRIELCRRRDRSAALRELRHAVRGGRARAGDLRLGGMRDRMRRGVRRLQRARVRRVRGRPRRDADRLRRLWIGVRHRRRGRVLRCRKVHVRRVRAGARRLRCGTGVRDRAGLDGRLRRVRDELRYARERDAELQWRRLCPRLHGGLRRLQRRLRRRLRAAARQRDRLWRVWPRLRACERHRCLHVRHLRHRIVQRRLPRLQSNAG